MAEGECWLFDTWRLHRVLNQGNDERIHLVADTVGGEGFWGLVGGGRTPGPAPQGWQPRLVPPDTSARPELDLESFNLPKVMTPWEVREHIVFLLGDALPDDNLAAIHQALLVFSRRWQGLWSCYGDGGDGWPRYRDLLERTQADLLARGIEFTSAPHRIYTHPDGTEEWMGFFKDPEGRPLAIMSQVIPH